LSINEEPSFFIANYATIYTSRAIPIRLVARTRDLRKDISLIHSRRLTSPLFDAVCILAHRSRHDAQTPRIAGVNVRLHDSSR